MAFPLTGIENSNDFYSQHYLDEVLENDLKELFASWQEQGSASPAGQLKSMAGDYFRLRDRILKARTLDDRIAHLRELAEQLLPALGYDLQPEIVAFEQGALPVLACYRSSDGNPALVIAAAPMDINASDEDWRVLNAAPLAPSELLGRVKGEGSAPSAFKGKGEAEGLPFSLPSSPLTIKGILVISYSLGDLTRNDDFRAMLAK